MSALWILMGLVLLGTVLWLVLPLLRGGVGVVTDEQDALNLVLYQTRLAELAADQQAGTLDTTHYSRAQAELEQEFAHYLHATPQTYTRQGRWLAIVLLIFLPALAVLLYAQFGNPAASLAVVPITAAPTVQAAGAPEAAATPPDAAALQPLLTKLAQRLHDQPEDGKGWMMLGRTYTAMERFAEANLAFARARQLLGDDPELLLHYAEALGSVQDGKLDGLAGELILRAAALQPDNPRGLFLAGLVTYQAERFGEALAYWQQLAALVKDDPEPSALAAKYVAQAQTALLAAPATGAVEPASVAATPVLVEPVTVVIAPPAQVPVPQEATAAAPLTQLTLRVSLAPELQAPADATVFVFARAAAGPKMPLAIQRLRVADLPATVTLNDSMAMAPQFKLSQFSSVIAGARVSFSGDAVAHSGDLEGLSAPLAGPQPEPVELVIRQTVP